jgi:hypothetical protein
MISDKTQAKPLDKTTVSRSVTGQNNDSEYYYLGRKILVQQNFTKKEDRPFDAYYQALKFLSDRNYHSGSLAVTSSPNIAVIKECYNLPEKWHNLDKEEIASIDGVIRSFDYREGQVTVMLFN